MNRKNRIFIGFAAFLLAITGFFVVSEVANASNPNPVDNYKYCLANNPLDDGAGITFFQPDDETCFSNYSTYQANVTGHHLLFSVYTVGNEGGSNPRVGYSLMYYGPPCTNGQQAYSVQLPTGWSNVVESAETWDSSCNFDYIFTGNYGGGTKVQITNNPQDSFGQYDNTANSFQLTYKQTN